MRWAWLSLVSLAAACSRSEPPRQPPPPEVSAPAPPEVSAPAPPAPAAAEKSLGVRDRGIYPDLDAVLQLPPPDARQKLGAVIDPRHGLLVVYADDWPVKVYPLGGSAELTLGQEKVALRPGDRDELRSRLSGILARRLGHGEVAPPGDADDDGIPDPLDVLLGAKKAVLGAASYDDAYFSLGYPMGDPPREKGACVDVIVRAVRNAGVDLQAGVIEDERRAGASHVDPNIDHRRVKNAIAYFERHWLAHTTALDDAQDPLRPGDVVFLDTFPSRPGPDHVGIVSDRVGKSGHPLVINLWTFGYKTQAMDLLGFVPVTHRFRFPSARE